MQVAPEFVERMRATHLNESSRFQHALASAPRVPGGRGPHFLLIDLKKEEPTIRVRTYHRGGWLGGLARSVFFAPDRAMREFRIWRTLQMRRAPLPQVVFARAERKRGLWHLHFATLDHGRAIDGLALFSDPEQATAWPAALACAARSIRSFHDAGGAHGDLNLKNLLFESSPCAFNAPPTQTYGPKDLRCVLVDLADASLHAEAGVEAGADAGIPPSERLKDLMRLLRSAEKNALPASHSARDQTRFLSAYCGRDRALRRTLLRALPLESRRLARHRLGWHLRRKARSILRASASLVITIPSSVLILFVGASIALGSAACQEALPEGSEANVARSEGHWSMLATGDTGRTSRIAFLEAISGGQRSVARAMTEEAQHNPVNAMMLLGDNFYWRGLDHEHLIERLKQNLVTPYCYFLDLRGTRSTEIASACPLPKNERRPVPIFAVLGNHDLETAESPELQKRVIPAFLPNWKMSEGLAQAFEVEAGISLILFESEVAIRDEAASREALLGAVRDARGPWRIVATHRPIATDDDGFWPEGGYPTMVQDALAEAAAEGIPVQLVLSAHHHNLQAFELIEPVQLLQIGLGSGARVEGPLAAPDHPASRFGALSLGFARIERIGQGVAERLSVQLIRAPRWPWLYLLDSPSQIARFEVDREGHVSVEAQ